MWIRRFVEPPKAACASIAFSSASGVSTSASVRPSLYCRCTARAVRRATSSQIGCPEGARAACGTVSPKRLGDDLCGCGGAEELTPAAGTGTGPAAELRRLVERHEPVREARAERLGGGGVLSVAGRQRHSSRDHGAGQVAERGERHRHRGQALVARADGDHAAPRGQAPHQPTEDQRRVVPVRERVEHPGRALGATVAGVGDVRGERKRAEPVELERRLADEQRDLPVAGVVAERDRAPVVRAQPSVGGEDQERVAGGLRRVPAHAGVLGQPEHVAGRPVAKELRRQGEQPGRALRRRLDVEEIPRCQLYRPRSRAVSHISSISPGFASKICPVERRM